MDAFDITNEKNEVVGRRPQKFAVLADFGDRRGEVPVHHADDRDGAQKYIDGMAGTDGIRSLRIVEKGAA